MNADVCGWVVGQALALQPLHFKAKYYKGRMLRLTGRLDQAKDAVAGLVASLETSAAEAELSDAGKSVAKAAASELKRINKALAKERKAADRRMAAAMRRGMAK